MKVAHIDYIWVDGFDVPSIRSKTKVGPITTNDEGQSAIEITQWNFDGSSTGQASTSDSERLLTPVRLYQVSPSQYMVLCEVEDVDGTPHSTNHRAVLREYLTENPTKNLWLGFEQEYFLTDNRSKNMFWAGEVEPPNTPIYYCSSGGDRVMKRGLVRAHADICWSMGIQVVGYNAEVAPSQWEFQCFGEDTLKACDDLWVSRYMLSLLAENDGVGVDWSPKPHTGWNGSGCHTNFSTEEMRTGMDNEKLYNNILEKMSMNHTSTISEYGEGNNDRLVGAYETSSFEKFSYGVADRSASVRIPTSTVDNEWRGYLEDRRPSSNCDPYRVANQLIRFV